MDTRPDNFNNFNEFYTQDQLNISSSSLNNNEIVLPGELLKGQNVDKLLLGFGIQIRDSSTLSVTLAGTIQKLNHLVQIIPIKTRYKPEIGNVIIGRVFSIQNKSWLLDIGSATRIRLPLSAINLPEGVNRKRDRNDELQMRQILEENDLVSAEVRKDGSGFSLHTRSSRYGRLRNGLYLNVPYYLIQKQKDHFLIIDNISILVGHNGWIWISSCTQEQLKHIKSRNQGTFNPNAVQSSIFVEDETVDIETRKKIVRFRSSILMLSHFSCSIHRESIEEIYIKSEQCGLSCRDLLDFSNSSTFITAPAIQTKILNSSSQPSIYDLIQDEDELAEPLVVENMIQLEL